MKSKTSPTSEIRQKKFRDFIHQKYNGHCAYCGCILDYMDMQVDHIVPRCFGGTDDVHNLNPSCIYCNTYKSNSHLELFRIDLMRMLNEKHEYLFKSNTKKQVAVNLGVLEIKKWDGVFYFEKVI